MVLAIARVKFLKTIQIREKPHTKLQDLQDNEDHPVNPANRIIVSQTTAAVLTQTPHQKSTLRLEVVR